MKQLIEIKKKLASDWFKFLQSKIIDEFQILENEIKMVKQLSTTSSPARRSTRQFRP